MKKKIITIVMVLFILAIGLSGCNEQNNIETDSENSDNNQEQTSSPIELKNVKMTTSGTKGESNYMITVSGEVKNNGNKPIDEVYISVVLFDSKGNELCERTFGKYDMGTVKHTSDLYMGETGDFEYIFVSYGRESCAYLEYATDYEIRHSYRYSTS